LLWKRLDDNEGGRNGSWTGQGRWRETTIGPTLIVKIEEKKSVNNDTVRSFRISWSRFLSLCKRANGSRFSQVSCARTVPRYCTRVPILYTRVQILTMNVLYPVPVQVLSVPGTGYGLFLNIITDTQIREKSKISKFIRTPDNKSVYGQTRIPA